jgi:hypothetical protein
MLTRRVILTGAAGASIAVIASAHGVATAADSNGFDLGYGNLEGGASGAFQKRTDGFGVFLKWENQAAEVFYKEQNGVVGIFAKSFLKGWSKVSLSDLAHVATLEDAAASFNKLRVDGAEFFLKAKNGIVVSTKLTPTSEGVQIEVEEISND